MKVFGVNHTTKDITTNQFDGVVENITTGSCLGFNDDELTIEGKAHNKALYISMKCMDNIISQVLVDIRSSLNFLSKSTLMKLTLEGLSLQPSALIIKAFDGSKQAVIGEVDVHIRIGHNTFSITLQVMDIHSTYTCLLGFPQIHVTEAVTSTIHQKLKFITSDKLIVVDGEEDILVSHLSLSWHNDGEGETLETLFQALEIASAMMVHPVAEDKKPVFSMASQKRVKAIAESGHAEGWGKTLELPREKRLVQTRIPTIYE